jgi:hypothetical protein
VIMPNTDNSQLGTQNDRGTDMNDEMDTGRQGIRTQDDASSDTDASIEGQDNARQGGTSDNSGSGDDIGDVPGQLDDSVGEDEVIPGTDTLAGTDNNL